METAPRLHWWILLGILVGALLGAYLNSQQIEGARTAVLGPVYSDQELQINAKAVNDELAERVEATALGGAARGISRIFMNLLRMIVIPLVFFSLVYGVAGIGSAKRLGRIGIKTAGWYVTTSLLAILTGLVVVNLIGPGKNVDIQIPTTAREASPPESFWEVLVNMVPSNVIDAAARFDMFGIILFAIFFGFFLLRIEDGLRQKMTDVIAAGAEVMMEMTRFVISLAPIGIGALIAWTVATSGPRIFLSLIGYVLTVALALGLHFAVILPALFFLLTRHNPYRYMRVMSPALVTGFSSASSSGTLAVTIERATDGGGVSERIASFVLPLGATVNMDGTALYECVTVLFIAQLHAATHPDFAPLTLGSQLLVVFLALAVSIGAAGIPHAGLVMMVIILKAVNLPLEYTALIWAVDRILDMSRTMVNLFSDSVGAAVIAHSEGELDPEVLYADEATPATAG